MTQFTLLMATLLVALVTGFLWGFATVIMPGIKELDDRAFLQAFKAMDSVIQRNQPIFVTVWLGSIVTLLVATGFSQINGLDQQPLLLAAVLYIVGVQLPTMKVNVPLNNQLQSYDLDTMSEEELCRARLQFESRWNWSNVFRTRVALIVTSILLVLLLTQ
jgi:uncharacterized membrane protein